MTNEYCGMKNPEETSYETLYYQLGKHRKKCRICGKLIEDGSKIKITKMIIDKYYPVKGIMKFVHYYYNHVDCICKT
jgi:hypothetical protein